MRVLLAASEVAPIVKIGGLGDVIGSLPKALGKVGVNADVIVPFYPSAKTDRLKLFKSFDLNVPFAGETHVVELFKTKLPDSDVDVILAKNARYFAPGGENAFLNSPKETQMFSFFSRTVVEYVKASFNTYDVVHCHDWHTGLITHLLQDELSEERPGTLFTIHNLFYQGRGEVELVKELGFSPGMHPLIDYDVADGDINLLYQGITSSDYISTVSENYSKEIRTKEFGQDMAQTLIDRQDRLVGILNGIDYSFFPRSYNVKDWKEKKEKCRIELKNELGLKESDAPLFSFVSRMDPGQKGLDILYVSVLHLLEKGGQFVLLGVGDHYWEDKFKELSLEKRYKGKISVNITFDVELANRVYSGADFFFAPSRYEPCGLTQLIAMHYGTPPIVRGVGGLKDTVKDGVTGFVFEKYSSVELNKAINKAFTAYADKEVYGKMVENALGEDFSWDKSAKEYAKLYERVVASRADRKGI